MNLIKTVLATAVVATIGTTSSAAILKYNGLSGYKTVQVNSNPTGGTLKYTGVAGGFKMEDTNNDLGLGTNFIAFCLDLAGTLLTDQNYEINNVDPYQVDRQLTALQRGNVEKLYDAAYSLVDVNNHIDASAFQLALWEAAYETDAGGMSLSGGSRVGEGKNNGAMVNNQVTARASEFLTAANTWDGINRYDVNFLDADDQARQDLVMGVAAVPLPAAGLMLLGGLGALAGLRRRSRKKS